MKDTQTPLTDSAEWSAFYGDVETKVTRSDFARTLERELAAMTEENAELKEQLTRIQSDRDRWQEDSMRQAATINRLAAAAEDRNRVDESRELLHQSELTAALARAEALEKDKARLDWVLSNVSGSAWACLGIFYSDGCRREHIDAATEQK